MRRLIIDIGNSCVKWAISQENVLGDQQRICYQQQELIPLLDQAWQIIAPPDEVWIASVAKPQIVSQMRDWLKTQWGIEPYLAQSMRYQAGVTNCYKVPQQLGVDRWLALIGAYHQLPRNPLCVVDCGTAITVDALSAKGQHLGGLIIPGIDLMRRSLMTETFALAAFQATEKCDAQSALLARDTHSGITCGTLYAVIGLVDYVMSHLEPEGPFALIFTGGNAQKFFPLFSSKRYQYCPDLVLRGLMTVATGAK